MQRFSESYAYACGLRLLPDKSVNTPSQSGYASSAYAAFFYPYALHIIHKLELIKINIIVFIYRYFLQYTIFKKKES